MKVFWRLLLLPGGNDRRKVWVKVEFICAACEVRRNRLEVEVVKEPHQKPLVQ
jgi:hypothetical protein